MNTAENLLEKLRTHAADAAPHEAAEQERNEALQLRNQLETEIRETRDWDQVRPLHVKLREAEEKFQHFQNHRYGNEEAIKRAWCLACDEFSDTAPHLHSELDQAAGDPVKFGEAELQPPTYTAVSEKLIQRQTACALVSPHHPANIAAEGRAIIALVTEITKALPVIQAERKALLDAAATYQKALSSKAA